MGEPRPPVLNVIRGLACALIGCIAAVTMIILLAAVYLGLRWTILGPSEFDRQFDLIEVREGLVVPVTGCAVLAGCAGWAAFAPVRPYRFAQTFAIIFLGTITTWAVLGLLNLTPQRLHSVSHPVLYPSEALLMLCPPVIVAGILTAMRIRRLE